MLGTMCALSGIYPMTCKPEDVFGAYEFRRKALMFSDITMRDIILIMLKVFLMNISSL